MHLAVVGAVERDEDLEALGPHFKTIWKAVLAARKGSDPVRARTHGV